MRLTYDMLLKYGFKQLLKKGFTEKQILNKVAKFYLKEQRQLIINEEKGLTLSRALRQLKRGKVDQGSWIQKTALSNLKNDISNLQKFAKFFGDDSTASKLLKQYQRGEINVYRLHNAMYSYSRNPAQYEDKTNNLPDEISLIFKEYNLELGGMKKYSYEDIRGMYE